MIDDEQDASKAKEEEEEEDILHTKVMSYFFLLLFLLETVFLQTCFRIDNLGGERRSTYYSIILLSKFTTVQDSLHFMNLSI